MLVLQNRLQIISAAPSAPQKPYRPGMWVVLENLDSHTDMANFYTTNLVGFIKRYRWNQLEPGVTQGDYDFSGIVGDVNYLATFTPALYLIILIEDKSYSGGTNNLPAYLDTETWVNQFGTTITGYEFPQGAGKATVRWKQRVVDRYNALTTALAAQFDTDAGNNKYFLGISFQETAAGSAVTIPTYDYTADAYKSAYQQEIQSASNQFRQSYVHWVFNFFSGNQSYMTQIAQYFSNPLNCPNQNVLAGGPDFKPWDATLNGTGDAFPQYEPIRLSGSGVNMFCMYSAECYDGRDISAGPNPPRPHVTVNVYSTIAASTAMVVNGASVVAGKLKITVPCTPAQSVTGVNPYSPTEYVQLDDGVNPVVNVIVQSIGGSGTVPDPYSATFTTNPAPVTTWVGAVASRYWTFLEYYAFARGTPTPDFTQHAVTHLVSLWWYPTSSTIYDYDNGTSPGGTDAKSFINAHSTVWP